MPNILLARYFQGQGLFDDLDFAAMKEGKPEDLFMAWLALADSQRRAMDVEFQEIFEMSCERGFRAIIDEAGWQLQENQDDLTSLPLYARPLIFPYRSYIGTLANRA